MFAASFTVAPASMVVGNSSAEATVTASLALATRTARLLVFGVVFGILCLVSISLVLPKRSCERGILANHDDMRALALDDSKSTSAAWPCKSAIVRPKLRRKGEVNLFARSDVAMVRR